jgi:hypothetical protein
MVAAGITIRYDTILTLLTKRKERNNEGNKELEKKRICKKSKAQET